MNEEMKFENEIEEFAFLLFSKEEIAIILGIDKSHFDNPKSIQSESYLRGQLMGKALIRKSLAELAKNGSMDAIKIYSSLLEKIELQKDRRQ